MAVAALPAPKLGMQPLTLAPLNHIQLAPLEQAEAPERGQLAAMVDRVAHPALAEMCLRPFNMPMAVEVARAVLLQQTQQAVAVVDWLVLVEMPLV